MNLRPLAYCFWVILVVRFALAFLFFRSQPKTATLVQGLLSVGFVFVLLGLRLCTHDSFPKLGWPPVMRWVTLYLGWTGLSLTWTFSDTFLSALGYWIMMLLDIAVVLVMLKWGDVEGIAVASLKGFITGVWIIDALALLFSSYDEFGRLGDPEYLHPNNLGHFTSIAALISIFFWRRAANGSSDRRLWAAGSIALCCMIIRTLSKTSIIAFAIAALSSLLLGSNLRLRQKLRIMALVIVLTSLSYGLISRYATTYFDEGMDSATTLTGRTLLWIESWDMILERPTIGYGILSFRNYAPQNWEIRTVHGHNEWVTQAFQLGFIGVLITSIIYLLYYRHFRKVEETAKRKLGTSILTFILIEGVASAEPTGLLFPLPLLVLTAIWTAFTRERLSFPADNNGLHLPQLRLYTDIQ